MSVASNRPSTRSAQLSAPACLSCSLAAISANDLAAGKSSARLSSPASATACTNSLRIDATSGTDASSNACQSSNALLMQRPHMCQFPLSHTCESSACGYSRLNYGYATDTGFRIYELSPASLKKILMTFLRLVHPIDRAFKANCHYTLEPRENER